MDKYAVEKVIGEGTYGIVYKAVEKASRDVVAIKKFKSAADEQLSRREIQACSMLNHPHIVSYRHSFRHEGLLHLVFDFECEGMAKLLARNRRGIKPEQAQKFTYQLCQALHYCHSNQVIHRGKQGPSASNVKPDNILIDEHGDIKLCDFGVARVVQFHGDPLSDYVATRWYRPPEQELRMDRYTFNADVWSVGCVLVELLTGRPLFPGSTQLDQLSLIQSVLGPLPPVLQPRLPRGLSVVQDVTKPLDEILQGVDLPDGTLDFLLRTLQLDAKTRSSAADCLAHPFLRALRDADTRKQLRQREERRCSSAHGGSDEDGIEEDIPGEKSRCRSPSPASKAQARRGDATSLSPKASAKDSPSTRTIQAELRAASPKKKHQQHLSSDNNTECDSDDIQELIEGEDVAVASPRHLHTHQRDEDKSSGETTRQRAKADRRRPLPGAKGRRDGDPIDRDSCYEDDFED